MNVVFDFGAVLFSWRPLELVTHFLPAHATHPQQAGQLAHALFAHPDWHEFDRGTLTQAQVVARSAARLQLDRVAVAAMVEGIAERLVPLPDSLALLAQLHAQGLPLYYLSNMSVPFARMLEQRHAFLRWFQGGIFSGDVQCIKPEPAIYQLLQARYGLDAAHTVLIDDLQANVLAARKLGWQGIHFQSAQQVGAELAGLGIALAGSCPSPV